MFSLLLKQKNYYPKIMPTENLCKPELIKGFVDYYQLDKNSKLNVALKTYFESSQFEKDIKSNKFSGGFSYGDFSLDAKNFDNKKVEFRQYIKNDQSLDIEESTIENILSMKINNEALNGYFKCVEKVHGYENKIGKVWEKDDDRIIKPNSFSTSIIFWPLNLDDNPAVIKDIITTSGTKTIQMEGIPNRKIKGSFRIFCIRDSKEDLSFTLNTNKGNVGFVIDKDSERRRWKFLTPKSTSDTTNPIRYYFTFFPGSDVFMSIPEDGPLEQPTLKHIAIINPDTRKCEFVRISENNPRQFDLADNDSFTINLKKSQDSFKYLNWESKSEVIKVLDLYRQ
jgi:hypothetical protein